MVISSNIHNTTRGENFVVNFSRTKIGQNEIFSEGIKHFNNLPIEISNEKKYQYLKTK